MNRTAVAQEALVKALNESQRLGPGVPLADARIARERILRSEVVFDAREHARIAALMAASAAPEEPMTPMPPWQAPSLIPGETFVLLPSRAVRIRVDDGGLPSAPMDERARAAVVAAKNGALYEVGQMDATPSPKHLTEALSFPVLEGFSTSRIEGGSLGLSAAIATISFLYTRAPSAEVAGTAELNEKAELLPVEPSILYSKVESLIACWPQVKTLVVADAQAIDERTMAALAGRDVVRCRRLHERRMDRPGALEVFFPDGIQENFIRSTYTYLKELGDAARRHNAGYFPGAFVMRLGKPFDFDAWRANMPPVTYVSGEFGTGKTRFCLELITRLCTNPHSTKPLVVAYVDLSRVALKGADLRKVVTSRPDAARTLLEAFDFDGLRGAMTAMRVPPSCEYPLIVVLEGIDEITDPLLAQTLIALASGIANDARVASDRSIRFVISGRVNMLRHHFATISMDRSLSVPKHWLLSNQEAQDHKLVLLRLWKDDEVSAFVGNTHGPAEADSIRRVLRDNENLRELCRRPLVLDLLCDAVASGGTIRSQTLLGVFDYVWEGYASKLRGVDAERVRRALELLAYRTWMYACQVARERGEAKVNNAALVFRDAWLEGALLEQGVPHGELKHYKNQALIAPLFRNDLVAWDHRMFLDYFIARYVSRNLRDAVEESKECLQDTFCRLGLLDLLRDAIELPDELFLCKLLEGTDETRVFASHLIRRREFARSLPALEAAYDLCVSDQAKTYLIFAILSHQPTPGERYLKFVMENSAALLDTLRQFVEGEASDVCAFNLSRITKKEHRSKAALYLTSLGHPEVVRTRPKEIIDTVRRFLRDCSPRAVEWVLAENVLTLAAAVE
ncbi:hypothetical protein WME90_42520 [Sorangium sp. So ce375]|uniref:NACHT domain-containing protein n=1 Tax=Sorangium sp. So ce375 TaxID=3133306 RepID=UPI003F5B78A0